MGEAPTMGSLFAGIGGFDLGFERAGFDVRWQVENDAYCNRVLAKHWPNVKRYGDIRDVQGSELERVDVICGGDPCQENSNARHKTGLESPSLGYEFIRVVDACRPLVVLRENPSRVRADAPWPWWRFRSVLERLGYVVLPFRLRACCFGAEHRRDRLFLLAELSNAMQAGLQGHEFVEVARAGQQGLGDSTKYVRWHATPRVCRGADGIPSRAHRLRALGNAVVPQVAEWIARRIYECLEPEKSHA